MAPSSYKVVGLLSLLHSMTAVVANPVQLLPLSSITSSSVILTSGTATTLLATPDSYQELESTEPANFETDDLEESENESISDSDSPNDMPVSGTQPSPDGSCGGATGNTCVNSTFGDCCSEHGWCGSTTAFCTNCQAGFGCAVGNSAIPQNDAAGNSTRSFRNWRNATWHARNRTSQGYQARIVSSQLLAEPTLSSSEGLVATEVPSTNEASAADAPASLVSSERRARPSSFHEKRSGSGDKSNFSKGMRNWHGMNATHEHGRNLTNMQRPNSTMFNSISDSRVHRPLAPGIWSWRHPQRPGSAPKSSGNIPLTSDQDTEKSGSSEPLNARGEPSTDGKTVVDPQVVIANHRSARAKHRSHLPWRRQVSTAKSSISVTSALSSASKAASTTLVTQSGAQSVSASAASTTTSGTSTLQGSVSSTSLSASASATAKKRGILYSKASSANAFIGKLMISWASNWYSNPQSFSASGVEYSPLLWAPRPVFLNSWQTDAKAAIAAGAKAILGFHEPDQVKGANLSAADAATAYKKNITDLFAGTVKLGSVSVSNKAASNQGLAYLSQFMSACGACKIDFINIHWLDTYDSGTAQRFKDYVDSAWTKFQLPIWVGQFGFESASHPTADQQIDFLKTVLPWLDQHQHVDRYAYYMANNMTTGGTLNLVGTTYASFTANATT